MRNLRNILTNGLLSLSLAFNAGCWQKDLERVEGQGSIYLNSNPTSAQVFLGDTLAGVTPFSMGKVQAGEHKVRIKKENYDSWNDTIFVKPSDAFLKTIKLSHETSKFIIWTNPAGAEIRINKKYLGKTPYENYSTTTGDYSVDLVLPGYAQIDTNISVSKPLTSLNLELEGNAVNFEGKWISKHKRKNILDTRRRIVQERRSKTIRIAESKRQQNISLLSKNLDYYERTKSWSKLNGWNFQDVIKKYRKLVNLNSDDVGRLKREISSSFRGSLEDIVNSGQDDYSEMIQINSRLSRLFPGEAKNNYGLIGTVVERRIKNKVKNSLNTKESKIESLRKRLEGPIEGLYRPSLCSIYKSSDFYDANFDLKNLKKFSPKKLSELSELVTRSKKEYDKFIVRASYDVVANRAKLDFSKIFRYGKKDWWINVAYGGVYIPKTGPNFKSNYFHNVRPFTIRTYLEFRSLSHAKKHYSHFLVDKDFKVKSKSKVVVDYLNSVLNTFPDPIIFEANKYYNEFTTKYPKLGFVKLSGDRKWQRLMRRNNCSRIKIPEFNEKFRQTLYNNPFYNYYKNNDLGHYSKLGKSYRTWLKEIENGSRNYGASSYELKKDWDGIVKKRIYDAISNFKSLTN